MKGGEAREDSVPSGAASFQETVARLQPDHRTFRLVVKGRSPFMKAIYYGAGMFLWCPTFLTSYTTTILTWVYMPEDLLNTEEGYTVLRHEEVHIKDCLRTGVLPFVVSYLFLLPSVLTSRAYWELRAYRVTMQVEHELTGQISLDTVHFIAQRFVSSDYFWMFPFRKTITKKLMKIRQQLLSEDQ